MQINIPFTPQDIAAQIQIGESEVQKLRDAMARISSEQETILGLCRQIDEAFSSHPASNDIGWLGARLARYLAELIMTQQSSAANAIEQQIQQIESAIGNLRRLLISVPAQAPKQ